jgi:hypothetical protein
MPQVRILRGESHAKPGLIELFFRRRLGSRLGDNVEVNVRDDLMGDLVIVLWEW